MIQSDHDGFSVDRRPGTAAPQCPGVHGRSGGRRGGTGSSQESSDAQYFLRGLSAPGNVYQPESVSKPATGRGTLRIRKSMAESAGLINGHEGVSARLKSSVEGSERVQFRVLDTYAAGSIVINHRIDQFISSRPLTWEGVGVFFVKDGKIKEWSDYTIRVQR